LSLFDAPMGDALREAGIADAQAGAHPVALADALRAVEHVARRRRRFTTDAVWARLRETGAVSFTEPRAMGAVMRLAQSEACRYVEPTDEHELSKRPECHRRPVRVWRSLFAGAGDAA
jgi:hypothetical protein